MTIDFILLFLGVAGFIILFIVMVHLSERMGEGMGISRYYLLYYIGILALIIALSAGLSIHYIGKENSEDILFALLTIGNAIAMAASFKYWWWLKGELWVKKTPYLNTGTNKKK